VAGGVDAGDDPLQAPFRGEGFAGVCRRIDPEGCVAVAVVVKGVLQGLSGWPEKAAVAAKPVKTVSARFGFGGRGSFAARWQIRR